MSVLNLKYIAMLLLAVLLFACGDEKKDGLFLDTEATSIELFYIDSLNNENLVRKIYNRDTITEVIEVLNNGKQVIVKMFCVYDLKIHYKTSIRSIQLKNKYANDSDIVYQLNTDIVKYLTNQQ